MLEQQARFDENLNKLEETRMRQAENINRLYESVTAMQAQFYETATTLEAQAEADRTEIRAAINNLIVADEVTRRPAEDVARPAINNSQRITAIEQKPS
jgi:hypothetical protein